jgi:hypothetical protein
VLRHDEELLNVRNLSKAVLKRMHLGGEIVPSLVRPPQ